MMLHAVRVATLADVDAIVTLGHNFIAGTQYAALIKPDMQAMRDTVSFLIDQHVVFVLEDAQANIVGMLGMATYPHVVSGEKCASELFWWIEPEHRGHGLVMLRRAESWARSAGAALIQMVQPESEPHLGEVYTRLGYSATERQFQKRLS